MSLIQTCELNDLNHFDCLTDLQNRAKELAKTPTAWMPWNYRWILLQTGSSQPPA